MRGLKYGFRTCVVLFLVFLFLHIACYDWNGSNYGIFYLDLLLVGTLSGAISCFVGGRVVKIIQNSKTS